MISQQTEKVSFGSFRSSLFLCLIRDALDSHFDYGRDERFMPYKNLNQSRFQFVVRTISSTTAKIFRRNESHDLSQP